MTTHQNRLVADYLRRLDRAADSLPRPRRTELVDEIREHIDDALLEARATDETAVRNVLERLGPPDEIVAAAGPARRESGKLELAAMIALAIPFLGWLVGIVLVAASRVWRGREKVVAIGLVLVPTVMLALGLTAEGSGSSGSVPIEVSPPATVPTESLPPGALAEESGDDGGLGPIELVVVLGTLLAGPLAAVYLGSRLRRGREPAELVSA